MSIHSHLLEVLSPTPQWMMNKDWLPLLGFFIITACHPMLLGIILVLMGEIFPTNIRSVSIGIVHGVGYLALAFSTQSFPYLEQWLNSYVLNYYYAGVALALTWWSMLTMKDIDSLSLVEIEQMYGSKMEKSKAIIGGKNSEDPKESEDLNYCSLNSYGSMNSFSSKKSYS